MSLVAKYIEDKHAAAFKRAALRFNVYILVRATNSDSRRYIGLKGYTAKPLDCKAKTAKQDVGQYELKGLVVDPSVHPGAFAGRDMEDVWKQWNKTAAHVWKPGPGESRAYLPAGKRFTVNLDPNHKHYGCLTLCRYQSTQAMDFIYGDYDLYAIVPAANTTETALVREKMLDTDHVRGKEMRDVQYFLNREMGVPLVLHGDQEKFSQHTNEDVVVFWPDGRMPTELLGKVEIERFYATTLNGRKTGGGPVPPQPHAGLWHRV
jgi:hypothetical protein